MRSRSPNPRPSPQSHRAYRFPLRRPLGRRAISPLVATVLLLAFAVAIGTMVVSYLVDLTKSRPCDHVAVELVGATSACYKDGQVAFILANTDETAIKAVKVRLVNDASKDLVEKQLVSSIEKGSASRLEFEFVTISPTSFGMSIIPIVEGKEGDAFCDASPQRIDTRITEC